MSLRCTSCNVNFNDKGSLEVHYSYNHSVLVPDACRPAASDPDGSGDAATSGIDESNNNNNHPVQYFKYQPSPLPPAPAGDHTALPVMTAISPGADMRDFHYNPIQHCGPDRLYDVGPQSNPAPHHHYDTYINSEYGRTTPIQTSVGYPSAFGVDPRYHPYYKQTFRESPVVPLLRCDKCSMQLPSHEMLLHHISISHPPAGPPGLGIHNFQSHRFGPIMNGHEPQAEILDLDSHKVHLYQPPNGETNQDTGDPWARAAADEKQKYYQQHQPKGMTNGRRPAGSSNTSLPSPDFGSVSTTTDSIEILQQTTRSPYFDPQVAAAPQISSSDNPPSAPPPAASSRPAKSSSKSSSNASWKSNEARRPKTYNCSACNKWFTSSGHLKRHYNTTLHKNAVKQSGVPDPANLPVSAHHHPQKDPAYGGSGRQVKSEGMRASPDPPFRTTATNEGTPSPAAPGFMLNSPNLMAGPLEMVNVVAAARGPACSYNRSPPDHSPLHRVSPASTIVPIPLQHQPAPLSTPSEYTPAHHRSFPSAPVPLHTLSPPPHLSAEGAAASTPFFHQPTPTMMYPNFKSPHVSTSSSRNQVTPPTSLTGKMMDDDECCTGNDDLIAAELDISSWNADQFLSDFDRRHGNVGGGTEVMEMLIDDLSQGLLERPLTSPGDLDQPPRDDDEDVSSSSNVAPPPEARTDDSSAGTAEFTCEKCHKFFNKACYLTQHNKSFHSGFKPYKCGRCGKRFLDGVQFKIHTDKHAGDKPYKCEICPKAFNHKTDLRRHACLHTNVRPYSCDICHKGFIRKDHMVKHRETHQNRKTAATIQVKLPQSHKLQKHKKQLHMPIEGFC